MFVNRQNELEALTTRFASGRAEFVVVTGRRRVGKTALLAAFANGKRALRFTAFLDSEEGQLRRLSALLRQLERPEAPAPPDFSYGSWEALFQTIGALARHERLLVILDEWPYLAGASPRLASVLQVVWDESLQHTGLMLALSGSYLSVMERDILGQQAPLYGRRTGQLVIHPLEIGDAAQFLPAYSPDQMVEVYAVAGGMPGYLLQLSDDQDLWANLRRAVFSRDTFLYQEPDLLLREELREPRLYAALLRAIAQGYHQVGQIAQAAGFSDRATATRYMDTLRSLGLVENRQPVTPQRKQRSWGTWHLLDPYLRFLGQLDSALHQPDRVRRSRALDPGGGAARLGPLRRLQLGGTGAPARAATGRQAGNPLLAGGDRFVVVIDGPDRRGRRAAQPALRPVGRGALAARADDAGRSRGLAGQGSHLVGDGEGLGRVAGALQPQRFQLNAGRTRRNRPAPRSTHPR